MPFADTGLLPLWPISIHGGLSASVTSTNIAASTHWAGGQFYASKTGTISAIYFSTGTVTSPVFELEAAITALDANGYPLGTDVAVSSTTIANPSATTDYSVTISASVTVGTLYGIIVRVKSGTYTSGSVNVIHRTVSTWFTAASSNLVGTPCSSNNIGSNTKNNAWTCLMPKYSGGWQSAPGILPISAAQMSTHTLAATSGHSVGNRFTLAFPVKVFGYLAYCDQDNDPNLEMYSGSDNTAISGSAVQVSSNYRAQTSAGSTVAMLATPLILNPGTYRVGIRNTSAAANSIKQLVMPEAGMFNVVSESLATVYKTVYTGSWADTDTTLCAITPLVSAVDSGAPWPSMNIGGIC